jgi:HlyD family secretion protein
MKNKFVLMGGIAILILIAAGVFVWQRTSVNSAGISRQQTATVTRGSLVATVNAAGNVFTPNTAAIAFSATGRLAQVPIHVGDQVKKGQLLMQLDLTDLQLALTTAQTNLAGQQANFDSTQASQQFAVQTAQVNVASAQAGYDSAKATNGTNSDQITVAKAALEKARVTLQTAQIAYNTLALTGATNIGMSTQAATLQTATSDYTSALGTYNITIGGINDSALKTAQATLDNNRTALDQAQKNLETNLKTAQASLDNAKVAVEQAQRNLDAASLSAPFDGYVSAVNFSAGDTPSGTAVSLVDLSNLQVKVVIAEVDIAKIAIGQVTQMTADALPGKTYQAKVLSIGPVGTVTSGVVNYPVTVVVTNPDTDLKPGMTANLAVEVDRRDNVLLVPTRALRNQGTQKTVTVVRQDKAVAVPVGTGLSSDTMIEVTSGLAEGDQVVVGQTQTQQRGGVPGLGGLLR